MKTLVLDHRSGKRRTPLSNRIVKGGVPFHVCDREATFLLDTGKFMEIDHAPDDSLPPGIVSATEPLRTLPSNWEGMNILIKCKGGIGDSLIACTVAAYLKTRSCGVVMQVLSHAVPFIKLVKQIDMVSTKGTDTDFDVVLDLNGYLCANSRQVVNQEFHSRALDVAGCGATELRFPAVSVDAKKVCKEVLQMVHDPDMRMISVHPDASGRHRCWPENYWVELIRRLPGNYRVMVLGQTGANYANIGVNCSSFTPMEQLYILKNSTLAICVDSCFLHFAGIMHVPTVAILGPSKARNCAGAYRTVSCVESPSPCKCAPMLQDTKCEYHFRCQQELMPAYVLPTIYSVLGVRAKKAPKVSAPPQKFQTRSAGRPTEIGRSQRLAFVFPHVLLGGGEVSMMTVAERIRPFFDMDVYALNLWKLTEQPSIRKELEERLNMTMLDKGQVTSATFKNYDIVLFYGYSDLVPLALSSMRNRPVSIRVVHTHFPKETTEFSRKWNDVIDASICVSPVTAEQIPNAEFIPNPCPVDRVEGKKQKFFSNGRPVMGYIGRLDANKNVGWMVQNLKELGCNLLVQGLDSDSISRKDLLAIAYKNEVEDRLRFLPHGRTTGNILASIDALMLLSKEEGFPMVVIEAGWKNVPVIATRVGALPALFPQSISFVDKSPTGIPDLGQVKKLIKRASSVPLKSKRLHYQVRKLCDPDKVAVQYRKFIRKIYGKVVGIKQHITMSRYYGIGDVLMSTAALNRIVETFPENKIIYNTRPELFDILSRTFPTVNFQECSRGGVEVPLTYRDCWHVGQHVIDAMGGKVAEMQIVPAHNSMCGCTTKNSVGIFPCANPDNIIRVKEWPFKKWSALVDILRSKGLKVIQLGHKSDTPLVPGVIDGRVETVDNLFGATKRVEHVIAVEGVANHVCHLLGKRAVILVGGGSSSGITSYPEHIHVKTPSECRCWGSIVKDLIGDACSNIGIRTNVECMSTISVTNVVCAFERLRKS